MGTPRRFYILGCQRTGTTLMRLILDSHPAVHCFDEWQGYEAIYADQSVRPEACVGFKLPCWTEVFATYECLGEKYRDDPIVFMLRDVRGAVASMLKLWPNNEMIAGYLADPNRDFAARFGKSLEDAQSSPHRWAIEHAIYWMYKTEAYFDLVGRGFQVLPVHYEKLVRVPRQQIRRVVEFLGLEWDDQLLQHHQLEHEEISDGMAIGNTLVSRPIDNGSANLWTTQLSGDQQRSILDAAGELNACVKKIAACSSPSSDSLAVG